VLTIGRASFTIRGVVAERAGASAHSASVPVCSSTSTTCRRREAGFRKPRSSRNCWRACPTWIADLLKTRADFSDDYINTRSYLSTDDAIGRDFEYLSLVGS
jgi:hypothetical protein